MFRGAATSVTVETATALGEAVSIPGTNAVLQFQAKTGMVKIFDETPDW